MTQFITEGIYEVVSGNAENSKQTKILPDFSILLLKNHVDWLLITRQNHDALPLLNNFGTFDKILSKGGFCIYKYNPNSDKNSYLPDILLRSGFSQAY